MLDAVRKQVSLIWTEKGASLPTAKSGHRGAVVLKRNDGVAADLAYLGLYDAAGAPQLRQIATTDITDTLYPARKSTATGWTSAVGAAMGSSPGAITQSGAEYTGRILADSGSSGTTTGVLFTVTFATERPNSNYNIFINPQNVESARCNAYGINDSTTQFTIRCQVAPNVSEQLRFGWLIEDRTP